MPLANGRTQPGSVEVRRVAGGWHELGCRPRVGVVYGLGRPGARMAHEHWLRRSWAAPGRMVRRQ